MHKDRAFQASSPKNFKAAFTGGFFLFFNVAFNRLAVTSVIVGLRSGDGGAVDEALNRSKFTT